MHRIYKIQYILYIIISMKSWIKGFVKDKLGTFLEGLEETEISYGVKSATMTLKNVRIKPEAIQKFKLPVQIKLGMVKSLYLMVPWLNIGSSPVEITLEGLNLLMTPQDSGQWETDDIFSEQALETKLATMVKNVISEIQTETQQGYFDRIKIKVLDNLVVQIKDVHIRIEETEQEQQAPISPRKGRKAQHLNSFGILLTNFDFQTINMQGERVFHDRTAIDDNITKRLRLQGFAVYLNSADRYSIHAYDRVEQILEGMDAVVSHYREKMSQELAGQNNSSLSIDVSRPVNHNTDECLNYILKPLTLQLRSERTTKEPYTINVDLSLKSLGLSFNHDQLKSIIKFVELAQNYKRMVSMQAKQKKFKFLRPIRLPGEKFQARQMWTFAIECVRRSIRTKLGALNAFIIPFSRLVEIESQFKPLLLQYVKANDCEYNEKNNQLTKRVSWSRQQRALFFHALQAVDQSKMKDWVKDVATSIQTKTGKQIQTPADEQLIQTPSSRLAGAKSYFTGYWFGKQAEDDGDGDDDEFFDCDDQFPTGQEQSAKDELQREINIRNAMELHVSVTVHEFIIQVGKINSHNNVDGIEIFNRGMLLTFQSPSLGKLFHEFTLQTSLKEFGVSMITINRKTGRYEDYTTVILANKQMDKNETNSKLKGVTYPKTEEDEPQWKVKIVKNTQELIKAGIEYDIKLETNSLLVKYMPNLVLRAKIIAQLKVAERTQTEYFEKMEEVQKATQNQLIDIIYKKRNRYSIKCKSPVFVLPIEKTFDGRYSPIWVVRTGDVCIRSADQQLTNDLKKVQLARSLIKEDTEGVKGTTLRTENESFESFEIDISAMGLHYYQSFDTYQDHLRQIRQDVKKLNKRSLDESGAKHVMQMSDDQKIHFQEEKWARQEYDKSKQQSLQQFCVLEDFRIEIALKLKKSLKGLVMTELQRREYDAKPKVIVGVRTTSLVINLSHYIYNRLCNLKKIFDMDPAQLAAFDKDIHETNVEKYEDVVQNMRLKGYLQMFDGGDSLERQIYQQLPTVDAPSELRSRRKSELKPSRKSASAMRTPDWESVFCILSEKNINFYGDEHQTKPFDWFYLKNCAVKKIDGTKGLPSQRRNLELIIENVRGDFRKLKFVVQKERDKWFSAINNVLNDDMFEQLNDENALTARLGSVHRSMSLRGSQYRDSLRGSRDDQVNQQENKFKQSAETMGLIGATKGKRKPKKKEQNGQDQSLILIELDLTFSMPQFTVQLMKLKQTVVNGVLDIVRPAVYDQWVTFQLKETSLQMEKRPHDEMMTVKIQEVSIEDTTMTVNNMILGQAPRKLGVDPEPALHVVRKKQKDPSPRYTELGLESLVEIKMQDIIVHFFPQTVNQILKLFRAMKPQTKPVKQSNLLQAAEYQQQKGYQKANRDEQSESEPVPLEEYNYSSEVSMLQPSLQYTTDAEQEMVATGTELKDKEYDTDCREKSMQKERVICTLSNVQMNLLHHEFQMVIFRTDLHQLELGHETWYDHQQITMTLEKVTLYDTTGYPYTISPKQYFEQAKKAGGKKSLKKLKLSPLVQFDHMKVTLETYQSQNCPRKPQNNSSRMSVSIKPMRLFYIQEVIFRFQEYFQQQFIDCLTMTDPYVDPKKDFIDPMARQKRTNLDQNTDWGQPTEIALMDVKIEDMVIILKPRPKNPVYFMLSSPLITVGQELYQKEGRVFRHPEIALAHTNLWTKIQKLAFHYCKGSPNGKVDTQKDEQLSLLKQPFDITVDFEKMAYAKVIDESHHTALKKAANINITFEPILLVWPQKVYTYLLSCSDLNLAWSDSMRSEYYFIKWVEMEDMYKQYPDVVDKHIHMDLPTVSLTMRHSDSSLLAELVLQTMQYSLDMYLDGVKTGEIFCKDFYILEQVNEIKEDLFDQLRSSKHDALRKRASSTNRRGGHSNAKIPISTDQNIKKQVIVGPLNSPGEVTIKQIVQSGAKRKDMKLRPDECQYHQTIDMRPTGQKTFELTIRKLKIFVKPQVFAMVKAFFMNSFPKYTIHSKDKPLGFNDDPEKAPKMKTKTKIRNSLICFYNRPGYKSIACEGNIDFEMTRDSIVLKKEKIVKRIEDKQRKQSMKLERETKEREQRERMIKEQAQQRKDMVVDFFSKEYQPDLDMDFDMESQKRRDTQHEISDNPEEVKAGFGMTIDLEGPTEERIYKTVLKIRHFCPFMCSVSYLNDGTKSFGDIKKRQLLQPFDFTQESAYYLFQYLTEEEKSHLDKSLDGGLNKKMWGVQNTATSNLGKTLCKMSIQDAHLIFQLMAYMAESLTKDLVKKLKQIFNQLNWNESRVNERKKGILGQNQHKFGRLRPSPDRIQTIAEEIEDHDEDPADKQNDKNLSSDDNNSSHLSEDNDALFNQDLITAEESFTYGAKPGDASGMESATSGADTKELIGPDGKKITPMQKAQTCLNEEKVDGELLDCLAQLLTNKFEATMGSQMGRLGSMQGLFGRLTEEYCQQKLKKRKKFNKFVIDILKEVLELKKVIDINDDDDFFFEPSDNSSFCEESSDEEANQGQSDKCFTVGHVYPETDPESNIVSQKKHQTEPKTFFGQKQLPRKRTGLFASDSGLLTPPPKFRSARQNSTRSQLQHSSRSAKGPQSFHTAESGNNSGDSDEFESAQMEGEDSDEFMSAEEDLPPNKLDKDQKILKVTSDDAALLVDQRYRANSLDRKNTVGKDKDLVKTRKIKSKMLATSTVGHNWRQSNPGMAKSMIGNVRSSFIGAQNSAKQSMATSKSMRDFVKTKKKRLLKRKRSVIENVRALKAEFVSEGISVLFINDFDRCFAPVIEFSIHDIQQSIATQCYWTVSADGSEIQQTSENQSILRLNEMSAEYFNIELGIWEPFLEQMSIMLSQSENKDTSEFSLVFLNDTNLNITESCLRNLILTYQSWMAMPNFLEDKVKDRVGKLGQSHDLPEKNIVAKRGMVGFWENPFTQLKPKSEHTDEKELRQSLLNKSSSSDEEVKNGEAPRYVSVGTAQQISQAADRELKLRDSNVMKLKPIGFGQPESGSLLHTADMSPFAREQHETHLLHGSKTDDNDELGKTAHVEEVAPFTLVNQTDMNLVIVQGGLDERRKASFEPRESFASDRHGPGFGDHDLPNPSSFISGGGNKTFGSAGPHTKTNKKVYKLTPGDTKDYTVRYENLIKEQNQRQRQKNKVVKRRNRSQSVEIQNFDDLMSEASSVMQEDDDDLRSTNKTTDMHKDEETLEQERLAQQMILFKKNESVGLYFNKQNTVQSIDLNELSFDNPFIHNLKVRDISRKSKKRATRLTVESNDRDTFSHNPDDLEQPLINSSNIDVSQAKKRKKRLPRVGNLNEKDKEQLHLFKNIILYGVVLRKMRKELVIRTSCVFHNKTPYAQELLILPLDSLAIAGRFVVKPDQSYPLSLKYYKRHNLRLRMVKNSQIDVGDLIGMRDEQLKQDPSPILGESQDPRGSQTTISVQELDSYSEPVRMEDMLKLGMNSGQGFFLTNRHQRKLSKKSGKTYSDSEGSLFATVIKRQSAELVGCSDFVLLPPLIIKNCLPCFMQVKQHLQEEPSKSIVEEDDKQNEEKRWRIEKSEEKSFFVFTELSNKPGEMQIQLHADGFQQQNIILNMKEQRKSSQDTEITIKDKDDNPLKIGMKIQMHKAGFHLTFYAHAVILIEARQLMHMGFLHLYYCSAYLKNMEGEVAGYREAHKRGYVMLNKVDTLKMGISPDTTTDNSEKFYSDALEIKQTGIVTDFQIQTHNVSKVNMHRSRGERYTSRGTAAQAANAIDQKFNFAVSAHLHLCDVSDSLYTKVISISPKYVVVNSAQCALEVSQKNCEDIFSKHLGQGQRVEWNWENSHQPDLIVVRKSSQSSVEVDNEAFQNIPTYSNDALPQLLESRKVAAEKSSSSGSESDFKSCCDSEDPKKAGAALLRENLDRFREQKEHERKWLWSSGFDIGHDQYEQMTMLIREDTSHAAGLAHQGRISAEEAPKQKIIRVSKKIINDTTFIIFEEEDEAAPMYQIINRCNNIHLSYWQMLPPGRENLQEQSHDAQKSSLRRPTTLPLRSQSSDTPGGNQERKVAVDQLEPMSQQMFSFEKPQQLPLKLKIALKIDTHTDQTAEGEGMAGHGSKALPDYLNQHKRDTRWQEQEIEVTFSDKNSGIETSVAGGATLNSKKEAEDISATRDEVTLAYRDNFGSERKITTAYDNNGITKTIRFLPDVAEHLDYERVQSTDKKAQHNIVMQDYLARPTENGKSRSRPINDSSDLVLLDNSEAEKARAAVADMLMERSPSSAHASSNDGDILVEETKHARLDNDQRPRTGPSNQRTQKKKKQAQGPIQKQSTFQIKMKQMHMSIVGGSFYDLNQKQTRKRTEKEKQFENNPMLQDQINVRTMINNRKELALINICGVDLEVETIPAKSKKIVQFHIAHFQMDDQSTQNPLYPTIMQPKPYRTFGREGRHFLDVSMELIQKPKVIFVQDFSCHLAETSLTMADDFLLNMAFLQIRILALLNSTFTTVHPVFLKNSFYDDLSDLHPTEPTMRGLPNPLTISSNSGLPVSVQNMNVETARGQTRHARGGGAKKGQFGVHLENDIECQTTMKEVAAQFKRWMNQDVSDHSNKLVLKNFIIEEIRMEITFSFKTRHAGTEKSIQALGPLAYLKKTGFTVLSIDEHRLNLPRFECQQTVVSQDNLATLLGIIYKETLISEMSTGAFSVVALGQPAFLYNNIRIGIHDVVDKPVNGFKTGGWLGGFRGFGSGTISITKNISVGLIQTIQSFGKGFSQLAINITTDRDYAQEREDNALTEKPKDFVEGFGYGSICAINGITSGVLGLFTRPFIEVRKKGPKGIGRGTWQALTGLIFKPVSGCLDFVSKCAEGTKNTLLVFERKSTFSRTRQPRPFYGKKRVIKKYDDSHALIISSLLVELKMNEFQNDHFLEVKLIHPYMLLLTEEHLLLIEIKQKVLVWSILTNQIAGTTQLQNGMLIWLSGKETTRKYVGVPLEFEPEDDHLVQWIDMIAQEFQ